MKKDMPLEGLRWSRDSGSALYDTPQTAVLGRAGGQKNSIKFNVASSFYERIQKCVLSPYGKEEVVFKLSASFVNTLHLDKV